MITLYLHFNPSGALSLVKQSETDIWDITLKKH